MLNKSPIEPIPDEFESYEAVAEFWDSHDTTDYLNDFKMVQVEDARLRQRHFEVEIDSDLLETLSNQAKQKGVGVSQWVNQMIRATLSFTK